MSTKAEIEQRVNEIYNLVINGVDRRTIVQYGSKKWEITERQVDDYLARARGYIEQEGAESRSNNKAIIFRRIEREYQEAQKAGDPDLRIKAIRLALEFEKLLTPTVGVLLNGDLTKLTDDELNKRLAELESRVSTLTLGSSGHTEGIQDASFREVEEDGGQIPEGEMGEGSYSVF